MNAPLPTDLKTPKQLAKLLDVTAATVRRWLREGLLPGYRIGGRLRASAAVALALFAPAGPAPPA